jgi:DNA-binding transcriptional regulator YhcF (GntR family)
MKAHNETAHRYEELAGFVAGLVEKGTLRQGSRAPSLRQLSKDRRTSLTTALRAYQLLERHSRSAASLWLLRRQAVGCRA